MVTSMWFLLFAVAAATDVPSFEWVDDGSSDLPLLKITFPDGDGDDFAVLKHFDIIPTGRDEEPSAKDSCIYDGYLANEKDVYVTVTGGCAYSETFDIQFRSMRLNGHLFKVTEGQVAEVPSIFGRQVASRDGSKQVAVDKMVSKHKTSSFQGSNRDTLNPNGYYLKVKVIYDDNFKGKFGDDVVNAARRVMAQAQNAFMWKDSLKTIVKFKVDENVDYHPGKWVAKTDITIVANYSLNANYNAFVYLAYRNDEGGTVGVAYTGVTCEEDTKYRTSLNEYMNDDLTSGQTVAHEIGHNLGMLHDFNKDPKNPRVDSKNNPCSGVGGIMDYFNEKTKWSTCSAEDLAGYIGSMEKFCLEVIA